MITRLEGELEIDHDRGVIYFHNKENGTSTIRICRLGKIPEDVMSIDITHMHGIQIVEKPDGI